MAQLTWRNIDAPDFGSAIRALSDSNNQLQRAFSGVGQAFTDYGVRRQNENTGNIQLALSKYGTNADLQAAIQQGLLDPNALREQYGNFNAAEIAKYQNTLANDLQTREVNQQGIDQTNNLNQFGGQITDALVRARQGDRSAIDALSTNPNVLGSVLSKYSQDIATNLGQAGQDAETARNNMANNAIGRTNASANVMNAQTSRLSANAQIADQNRRWDAGQLQRQVSDQANQTTLDNRANVIEGAKQFNPQANMLPEEQLDKFTRSLINVDPNKREALLQGFKSAMQTYQGGNAAAQAQQQVAPVSEEVSNLGSGYKSIISSANGQANAWNNTISASQQSDVKSIPDAVKALKDMGLDTTDRKVNDFVQQAVGMGATPSEALAIASGTGRASYTSIIDGKTTLNMSAALDGVKDYMKYKTSTEGLQARERMNTQNSTVDDLVNKANLAIRRQQNAILQGRPDRAAALQAEVDAARNNLRAYGGLVEKTNPPPAPVTPNFTGWQPSWQR
ncbi:hypothetical protein Erwinia_phage_Pastis_00049 [Erwinia phage Pastis]|nr:hypothetical protein Erwinia_phage_Pastis_00049 [Erwinia phage Pastis]